MRAIQISKYGDASELELKEVQLPRPKAAEVLVKINDAGVNPFDWKVRKGFMKEKMPVHFPLTMGYDFAGEIAEVGIDVKDFTVGDRVFGFAEGSYAEYAIATPAKIAKLPKEISFGLAASLPTPAITAYQLVTDNVHPHGANSVLIHGAAGAVGSIAVQVAKYFGMSIYANAAKEDEKYLFELGADRVIDYKTQKFEDVVHEVDAVIDLVGGDTLKRSFAVVKKGGFVVTTVGPVPPDAAKQFGIETKHFFNQQDSEDLAEIAKLVAQGKVKIRIADVLPLEDAAEAQRMNESGKAHGKVILQVH